MAQQARERPGVYRTFPNQVNLRLSDEQRRRVEAAAKGRSKTVSEFMRDAIMVSVNAFEEEDRSRKQMKAEMAAKVAGAFVPQNARAPRVFSFQSLSTSSQQQQQQPPPQPQPIVVQTVAPPSVSSGRNDLDVLVDYLHAAKNTIDREERERVVTKVITSSTASVDEQKRFAKALDERVKARTPAETPAETTKTIWSFLK